MESPSPSPSWLRAGAPAIVFLAAFVAFTPALDGDFLNWDDHLVLKSHESWRGLGGEQVRWAFTTFHAGHYHPLTWLSHGLDYELWGMNPRGYHVVNLLLHAATSMLFYFILLRLLTRPGRKEIARFAAGAGALFFAIHPLRVESVVWITERRDVLSGALLAASLLAWLAWTDGRRRLWYGVALAAFALSLLSKAWGITLPAVLLVLDIFPLRRWAPGRRAALVVEKVPFFALAAVAGLLAFVAQRRVGAMDMVQDHTLVDRLVQAGYGLFFYLAKTIVPVGQNPLYALKPDFNPFELQYVTGAIAAILVTAILVIRRRQNPGLLAAWIVYGVVLSPVLGLTQAGPQLVAEKYSYLACLPFAAVAAAGVAAWTERPGTGLRVPGIVAGLLAVALGFGAWTYSHVWRDSVTLWTRAVELDPKNTQAWYNLGSAKIDLRPPDAVGARSDLSRAIELNPKYVAAFINRGIARQESDPEGAIADFDAAIRFDPSSADAFTNRGHMRLQRGREAEGTQDLTEAIRLNPRQYRAYMLRALAAISRRDAAAARADLDNAVQHGPRDPDPLYIRGELRDRQGDLDGAIADYGRALSLAGGAWDERKRRRTEELLSKAWARKKAR